MGQEEYLLGLAFEPRAYRPTPGNDHDHCEFCVAKFSQTIPDALTGGYCTPDRDRWICPTCFDDFAVEFGWRS